MGREGVGYWLGPAPVACRGTLPRGPQTPAARGDLPPPLCQTWGTAARTRSKNKKCGHVQLWGLVGGLILICHGLSQRALLCRHRGGLGSAQSATFSSLNILRPRARDKHHSSHLGNGTPLSLKTNGDFQLGTVEWHTC